MKFYNVVSCGILKDEDELHNLHKNEKFIEIGRKIRSCPFCGGKGMLDSFTTDAGTRGDAVYTEYHYVTCLRCSAEGPKQLSVESAIKCWNVTY